jgi:hypothetical protein
MITECLPEQVRHFLYRKYTRRAGISVPLNPISGSHSTQNTEMARFVLIHMRERNRSQAAIRGGGMQENKKKWMELCEQAADEQDPKKLAALILEINFVLEAKELRLTGKDRPVDPPSQAISLT